MKRIALLFSTLVFVLMSYESADALGIKLPFRLPKPRPTPTPPPAPTPTPEPCETAGPKVDPADDEYVVYLRAANGKYVTAICGGDDAGLMFANRDQAGEWETFYLRMLPAGRVSIRTSHGRFVAAELGGGGDIRANRWAVGEWEQYQLMGSISDGARIGFKTWNNQHFISARIDLPEAPINAQAPQYSQWEEFSVGLIKAPPVRARRGIVRADRRTFVDDDGPFYPLGQTLFWALHGWKNDRDRLKANLQFLKRHRFDYIRILGEVDWAQKIISPNWPDYEQVLGEFLDYAYDECGLRTEITMIGGGAGVNFMDLAQKIVRVINNGRQHKIMNIEVANESYQRPISLEQMREVGRYFRQNTPNLVALSSVEGSGAYKEPSGDWRADFIDVYMKPDTANLVTVHMQRQFGVEGWRAVRQTWDFKDLDFPVSHNEPIGPRSSVVSEMDPVRIGMLRAAGIINGSGAYVLHNAAGVYGEVVPERQRPANLWEVPNIDLIMEMLRNIDNWMPARANEGRHWNHGWAGAPWNADMIWGDEGGDRGVNRNYMAATSDGWIAAELGVKQYVNFTATYKSFVEVYDIIQGKVLEANLEAGQSIRLEPVSRDNYGNGGLIVIGHYR